MIGLDTNVLVRYFTQDDLVQAEQANRFIEQSVKKGETLFLNSVVLCELVWVLESAYNYEKQTIIDTLEKITATAEFELENRNEIHLALSDFKNSNADFSDCLIGRKNHSAGCKDTWSFDQTTKKLNYFKLLEK